METKTDILIELTSISPLLAGLIKVNVFTVPLGYFDSIHSTVITCIQEEQGILNLPLGDQSTGVPEGYFDYLAINILDKIKGNETSASEMKSLSPLLYGLQDKNVFKVPTGYFGNLDRKIIGKISPATAKEEIKELSPLLHRIQTALVFEVPDHYFMNFPGKILQKVLPVAKIIHLQKRNSFIKYAVAAMMTGVMALGLYKYMENNDSSVINGNSVAGLDAAIEKGKSMNDIQFNEAIENLTEADISKYLENNGDISDVAVLGNTLEEKNLPSQEDYLMDETTLDNYLKEIEKSTTN